MSELLPTPTTEVKPTETNTPPVDPRQEADRLHRRQQQILAASLHELGLTFRTASALENDKANPDKLGTVRQIRTVRELLLLNPEDILAIPNLGEKTLEEIYGRLAAHGFIRRGFVAQESPKDLRTRLELSRKQHLQRRLGYRLPVTSAC